LRHWPRTPLLPEPRLLSKPPLHRQPPPRCAHAPLTPRSLSSHSACSELGAGLGGSLGGRWAAACSSLR